jgi:hypothetical protein
MVLQKTQQKAPYVIVGVTCKAPLAPSDLAYVDTYLNLTLLGL